MRWDRSDWGICVCGFVLVSTDNSGFRSYGQCHILITSALIASYFSSRRFAPVSAEPAASRTCPSSSPEHHALLRFNDMYELVCAFPSAVWPSTMGPDRLLTR